MNTARRCRTAGAQRTMEWWQGAAAGPTCAERRHTLAPPVVTPSKHGRTCGVQGFAIFGEVKRLLVVDRIAVPALPEEHLDFLRVNPARLRARERGNRRATRSHLRARKAGGYTRRARCTLQMGRGARRTVASGLKRLTMEATISK